MIYTWKPKKRFWADFKTCFWGPGILGVLGSVLVFPQPTGLGLYEALWLGMRAGNLISEGPN